MNKAILDTVELNHAHRCSVNYAKARCALDQMAKEEKEKIAVIQRGNVALAKKLDRELNVFIIDSKVALIGHLKGKCEPTPKGRIIKFFDGSEAKY